MGGDRAERIEAQGFLEEQIVTRKEEAVDLADKFKTKAQEIEDEVIDLANKFQATAERIDGHVWVSISSQGTNQQLLAHTPAVRASYFRCQCLPTVGVRCDLSFWFQAAGSQFDKVGLETHTENAWLWYNRRRG